jgi:hypothetical protein
MDLLQGQEYITQAANALRASLPDGWRMATITATFSSDYAVELTAECTDASGQKFTWNDLPLGAGVALDKLRDGMAEGPASKWSTAVITLESQTDKANIEFHH